MTIQEARDNIGQRFKWLVGTWWYDVITDVDENGWIIGNKIDAPAEDCNFVKEQPEQLKKHYDNRTMDTGSEAAS